MIRNNFLQPTGMQAVERSFSAFSYRLDENMLLSSSQFGALILTQELQPIKRKVCEGKAAAEVDISKD